MCFSGTPSRLAQRRLVCERGRMRKLARDTEVLAIVETAMPNATHEEKLQVTFEFWQFFDALWAIADRLVTDRERERAARDNSASFGSVETPSNA